MNTYGEEKSKTQENYSKISKLYISDFGDDHSNFSLIDTVIERIREKRMFLKPAIDLGSGPGTITSYLLKNGLSRIIAIDITPEFCEYMRKKFKDIKPSYVSVVEGDMVEIIKEFLVPYKNQIPAILAGFSLIHVPDNELDRFLKDLHELLHPDGLFYMSCHEGRHKGMEVEPYIAQKDKRLKTRERLEVYMNYFTETELRDRFKKAGFNIINLTRHKPQVIPGEIPVPKLQILAEKTTISSMYIGESKSENS